MEPAEDGLKGKDDPGGGRRRACKDKPDSRPGRGGKGVPDGHRGGARDNGPEEEGVRRAGPGGGSGRGVCVKHEHASNYRDCGSHLEAGQVHRGALFQSAPAHEAGGDHTGGVHLAGRRTHDQGSRKVTRKGGGDVQEGRARIHNKQAVHTNGARGLLRDGPHRGHQGGGGLGGKVQDGLSHGDIRARGLYRHGRHTQGHCGDAPA